MKLTKSEEELMHYLWKLEKAFMRDLLECYPDPVPAPTTIATLLKRMQEKGFVDFDQMGNSRQYYPLVPKKEYSNRQLRGLIGRFFDGSHSQFASFFTSETDLSEAELEELKEIINKELKKKRS